MQIVIYVEECAGALALVGQRIRERRLELGISQQLLAERIAVSRPTLQGIEEGASTVAIGNWVNALWALDRLEEFRGLLRPSVDLFAVAEREAAKRQRAPRR
jgi:transcriptional regulator with XRE-family HTH domain